MKPVCFVCKALLGDEDVTVTPRPSSRPVGQHRLIPRRFPAICVTLGVPPSGIRVHDGCSGRFRALPEAFFVSELWTPVTIEEIRRNPVAGEYHTPYRFERF